MWLHSKAHMLEAFVNPSVSLGNTNYNWNKLKQSSDLFKVNQNRSFKMMEVGIIIGHDTFELQKRIWLRDGNQNWARRCPNGISMGSKWSHEGQKRTKCLSFSQHRRHENGRNCSTLVEHRNLCFQYQRCVSGKERMANTRDATEYDEVCRQAVWSGGEPRSNLSKNYSTSLSQR